MLTKLDNLTGEMKIKILKSNGLAIKSITNKTRELVIAALMEDGKAIQYINKKERTEQMWILAIQTTKEAIQFAEEDEITEAMIIALLKQDGMYLEQIPKQKHTDHIIDTALRCDGRAIQFVEKQTNEKCRIAIASQCDCWEFIKNKTDDLKLLLISITPAKIINMKNTTTEMINNALEQDGLLLEHFPKCSDDLKMIALKQDGYALQFIDKPKKNMIITAITQTDFAFGMLDYNSQLEYCKYVQDFHIEETDERNPIKEIFKRKAKLNRTFQNKCERNLKTFLRKVIAQGDEIELKEIKTIMQYAIELRKHNNKQIK